jgi:hypothetical protein
MSLRTQPVYLVALLGMGLLPAWLAGCGGGGDGPPSKAEFIASANAVCGRAAAEQRALAPPAEVESQPPANRSSYVEPVLVKSIEKELRRLKALDVPPGERKKIEAVFKEIEKGLEDAKLDPLDPLVNATDPFRQANRLAREDGLKACAESSHAVIRPGTFAQLYETEK